MKLTRVSLKDFRCFGSATFDLTSPVDGQPLAVALIVGGNGSGKSSVLQAIAGFFDWIATGPQLEGKRGLHGADRLSRDDIRAGASECIVDVAWQDTVRGQRETLADVLRLGQHGAAWTPGDSLARWRVEVSSTAPFLPPTATGLIVSFDVYRLLPPTVVAGPNVQQVVHHPLRDALAPTVRRSGRVEPRFGQLKQWIVNLDFMRAKAKADRHEHLPVWDTLRSALDTTFHPYVFEGVDDRFDVLFSGPTGKVRLEALSDGYRSVFVVITDLLMRLSLAAPRPEDILQQEAVCLIDEIDAHLHPKWQHRVVPGLRTLFPNVQFIATTHSPFVVETVEPHQVFRLEEERP